LPNALRDRAELFALAAGAVELIAPLVERMSATDAQMVAAVAIMFGHVPRRQPVERAVELIGARDWSPADRLTIAHSLITGLTYRMEMFSFRSGALHPIPPHPGRTIPLELSDGGSRSAATRHESGYVSRWTRSGSGRPQRRNCRFSWTRQ
jgi:hypothetical protein